MDALVIVAALGLGVLLFAFLLLLERIVEATAPPETRGRSVSGSARTASS